MITVHKGFNQSIEQPGYQTVIIQQWKKILNKKTEKLKNLQSFIRSQRKMETKSYYVSTQTKWRIIKTTTL